MMSATIPSVAYARMMNGRAEGEGTAGTVGSGLGMISVDAGGVADGVQAVNRMASRQTPVRRRCILSKRQVQTMGQQSHRLLQKYIQVRIFVLEKRPGNDTQFLAELIFDPAPEGNGTIGAGGSDKLDHHRPERMLHGDQFVQGIDARRQDVRSASQLEHSAFAGEKFCELERGFESVREAIG